TQDCEYFPDTCTQDALCPAGLFDRSKPAGDADHFDLRSTVHLLRGRAPNDVWAIGPMEVLAHFDGASWKREATPKDPASTGRPQTLWALWLRESDEIAGVGLDRFYTREGAGWVDRGAVTTAPYPGFNPGEHPLVANWAAPGSDWLWVVTQTWSGTGLARLRLNGESKFEGSVIHLMPGWMNAIHGASPDEVWCVGNVGKVLRIAGANGDAPTITAYNSLSRSSLRGVWAASANDVWAVGFASTIRHYTGSDPVVWDVVSDVPPGLELNAVWGTSPTDIWAVGNDAVVLHYDGARWSRVKVAGLAGLRPNLFAVWAGERGHVWIGGEAVLLSLGGQP
ncbi:MAG: hypothetical protein K0S65_1196, partial [Labilithrix sp.]|nr:hypothetical protein [Labilithrix sp.]